jgi:hypothetical protein
VFFIGSDIVKFGIKIYTKSIDKWDVDFADLAESNGKYK